MKETEQAALGIIILKNENNRYFKSPDFVGGFVNKNY